MQFASLKFIYYLDWLVFIMCSNYWLYFFVFCHLWIDALKCFESVNKVQLAISTFYVIQVIARILFVDPLTRAVGLTLNPHLVQNKAPPCVSILPFVVLPYASELSHTVFFWIISCASFLALLKSNCNYF